MHVIKIHNKSGHNQTFEVHGWNGNKNLTVHAGKTATLKAQDGSSGAIIALHDGHEGEQAEITKRGFEGNDFFDLSNIVGAGGNMTVMQIGDRSTLKGDPKFMQHMDIAWHKASQDTRNKLKGRVFTDSHGKVKRIGPIKGSPELEKLVRTFANGKTYIGEGAWNGSPGVPSDNNQSHAGHGNKDILITYSDGDASPDLVHHKTLFAVAQDEEAEVQDTDEAEVQDTDEETEVQDTKEDEDEDEKPKVTVSRIQDLHQASLHQLNGVQEFTSKAQKPGIILTNKSHKDCTYFFYDNLWNGNGTAGANFDHPLKNVHLKAGARTHVPLPKTFKGRVQRGKDLPATWVEFQISASNDHAAHGDISLEQGCDCAAVIASTDGSGRRNGFTHDVVKGAPAAACGKKPSGEKAIQTTMGNWMSGPNQAAIDYLRKTVGQKRAYIVGGTGTDDVASKNNCLAVDMY